jgi:long-chain acyl-CoA synthetase
MQYYPFNNLYEILEANLIKKSNKTIIFQDDIKITNLQLKNYVDIVARFLINKGIKAGDKVGIIMSNSWQYVVNIFAISKIGAVIVPINHFFKNDEIAYVLNDVKAKLLFSTAKFSAETSTLLGKTSIENIVWVDGLPINNDCNISYDDVLNNELPDIAPISSLIDNTAFILFTSGTTGKPKGAELSFRNIFSNCEGSKVLMEAKDGDIKMICYLPMFHAFTLTATVILPIYSNSGLVIIPSLNTKSDFKKLLKQLLLKRCRYFAGVPDVYSAIAKAKLPWYFHLFHNVKGFISGAAPLSEDTYKRFTSSFKRGMLLEGYGITECSPIVSCNSPQHNKIGSVGKPYINYQVKIFDENMNEQPVNSVGEICVKGDCVMKGYYNRPEDTQENIINGWFKTGDIGRVDEDGYIFIMDRKKDLIISKGMNIYPREVEEVIYTNPKVNACAVIGVQDSEVGEIPIAFVELREDEQCSELELKNFIRSSLATFKLPRKIFFETELPRNATKKILKRELRLIYQERNKK